MNSFTIEDYNELMDLLTQTQRKIVIYINEYFDINSEYPSLSTMSEAFNVSRSAVAKNIDYIMKKGWLGKDGKGRIKWTKSVGGELRAFTRSLQEAERLCERGTINREDLEKIKKREMENYLK